MSSMEAHTVAELFVYNFVVLELLIICTLTRATILNPTCSVKLLGVLKTRSTPYHPQFDGLVEQFNHTLLNMLSIAAQDRERDWDLQLPLIMMAYRTSIQESIGATPFSLMFGREAHLPNDVMFGMPPGEESVSPSHYASS